MAGPSLLDLLLAQIRDDLGNAESPFRAQLMFSYDEAIRQLEYDLYRVLWVIEDAIMRGVDVSPAWLYQEARYRELIAKADTQLERWGDGALSALERTYRNGDVLAQTHAPRLLSGAGISASFGTNINTPAVEVLVQTLLRPESPVRRVIESYGTNATKTITEHLIQGVIQGKGPREVVREIIDDLASGTNRARLSSLVRTEHMRAYRESLSYQYEPYSHAIKAYRWLSAHDHRVCLACLAMDGEEFDEPQEIMHVNCRCICSVVGYYTPARYQREAGEQWLLRQDPGVQRGMFPSQASYDAWRDGDVRLKDFIGTKDDPTWGTSIFQRSGKDVLSRRQGK